MAEGSYSPFSVKPAKQICEKAQLADQVILITKNNTSKTI